MWYQKERYTNILLAKDMKIDCIVNTISRGWGMGIAAAAQSYLRNHQSQKTHPKNKCCFGKKRIQRILQNTWTQTHWEQIANISRKHKRTWKNSKNRETHIDE